MKDYRLSLKKSKRIVVKIGTSNLTDESGKINLSRIGSFVKVISNLTDQNKEVILVTSGAIGIGTIKLGYKERPKTISGKQAAAAVGQCELMHIYSKYFEKQGHIIGQMLLTKDVVENRVAKKNVINAFETLLKEGAIPIVNENDTVSVDEIEYGEKKVFGDNDTLSAIVASLIKADLLIILSDVDGFYDSDPRHNLNAKIIPIIKKITPKMEKSAGDAGTNSGTGGMTTKLSAAKIANSAGVNMILANGSDPKVIASILAGEDIGSLFISTPSALQVEANRNNRGRSPHRS